MNKGTSGVAYLGDGNGLNGLELGAKLVVLGGQGLAVAAPINQWKDTKNMKKMHQSIGTLSSLCDGAGGRGLEGAVEEKLTRTMGRRTPRARPCRWQSPVHIQEFKMASGHVAVCRWCDTVECSIVSLCIAGTMGF